MKTAIRSSLFATLLLIGCDQKNPVKDYKGNARDSPTPDVPTLLSLNSVVELGHPATEFLAFDPNPFLLRVPRYRVGGGSWRPGSIIILVFDPVVEFAKLDLEDASEDVLLGTAEDMQIVSSFTVTGIVEYRDGERVSARAVPGIDLQKLVSFCDMDFERASGGFKPTTSE